MRYFVFNEIDSREYFDFTKPFSRPFLPPIAVQTVSIPQRAGAVSLRNEIGTREFSVPVAIMALNNGDLRTRIRALAEFLIYDEDKPFYFSDEPNRVYYARFNGSSNDLEEIAAIGEGELTFLCSDPFAYSNAESSVAFGTSQEITATNAGSVEAFPKIRIVPSETANYIRIRNLTTGKQFIYLAAWQAGVPFVVDFEKNIAYNDSTKQNYLTNIALESDFWSLQKGANRIRIEFNDLGTAPVTSARLSWVERYY